MNIKGEEFNEGDIVFLKYRNIFGKEREFAGFFITARKPFFDFMIASESKGDGYTGFKIKRVLEIRKLK